MVSHSKAEVTKREPEYAEIVPSADILEEAGKAVVTFEVPGANSKSVNVEVRDSILTVEAKSSLTRDGMPVMFRRSFELADSVEVGKITARTQDGVLTLTLPKSEHAQVHRIAVA